MGFRCGVSGFDFQDTIFLVGEAAIKTVQLLRHSSLGHLSHQRLVLFLSRSVGHFIRSSAKNPYVGINLG